MYRYKVVILAYLAILTSSLRVEALPRQIEYLTKVGSYLSKRVKRGAVNFHTAITCHQPNINVLGTYGSYGCYCGFSGWGVPIDETDKCCQRHDQCYGEASKLTKTVWESFVSLGSDIFSAYDNKCEHGEVICAKNSPYQNKLCDCDKEAAACFYKASATYHPQLMGINIDKYCPVNSNLEDLNLTTHYENRYKPMNVSPKTVSTALNKSDVTAKDEVEKEDWYQLSTKRPEKTEKSTKKEQRSNEALSPLFLPTSSIAGVNITDEMNKHEGLNDETKKDKRKKAKSKSDETKKDQRRKGKRKNKKNSKNNEKSEKDEIHKMNASTPDAKRSKINETEPTFTGNDAEEKRKDFIEEQNKIADIIIPAIQPPFSEKPSSLALVESDEFIENKKEVKGRKKPLKEKRQHFSSNYYPVDEPGNGKSSIYSSSFKLRGYAIYAFLAALISLFMLV